MTAADGATLGYLDLASGDRSDVPTARAADFDAAVARWRLEHDALGTEPPTRLPTARTATRPRTATHPPSALPLAAGAEGVTTPTIEPTELSLNCQLFAVPEYDTNDTDLASPNRAAPADQTPGGAATARAIRTLTHPWWTRLLGRASRWHVLDAVPVGPKGQTVDHLLIGPAGVFTITTEHHPSEAVTVAEDAITVDGSPLRCTDQPTALARRAERLLSLRVSRPVTVTAVVSITGADTVSGRPHARGALVAASGKLARLLRGQPPRLSRNDVDDLYTAARRSSTWAS